MVVFWVVMRVVTRRRSRERAVAYGPLKLDLTLDFACLPGDWPALALETLPAAAANAQGVAAVAFAIDAVHTGEPLRFVGTLACPLDAQPPTPRTRRPRTGVTATADPSMAAPLKGLRPAQALHRQARPAPQRPGGSERPQPRRDGAGRRSRPDEDPPIPRPTPAPDEGGRQGGAAPFTLRGSRNPPSTGRPRGPTTSTTSTVSDPSRQRRDAQAISASVGGG